MKICLVQSDLVWAEPDTNRKRIEGLLSSSNDADIVVLPEMFTTGFCTQDLSLLEADCNKTLQWMIWLANKKNAAVAGSVAMEENGKYYNRFYFIKPDGSVVNYDKHHLFTYGGEDKYFVPGRKRTVVEYKGWRILLQVCYDLRFPVFSRNSGDYDIILYIASWPEKRRYAWDTLLRARAVENLSYVVGVNRVGQDPICQYSGGSALIDFMGGTLVSAPDGEEKVVCGEVSKEKLEMFRKHFPALNDRDSFDIKDSK